MKELSIFFSWQSDIPGNRDRLRKDIDIAIKTIEKEEEFAEYRIYRTEATRDEAGSPDIVETIHAKINQCAVFIADISPIADYNEKQIPNPNVLLEEGFALRSIGCRRIILMSNHISVALPFDIAHRRTTKIGDNLITPIRMALREAISGMENEFEQNAMTHDTIVFRHFMGIIEREDVLMDSLSSIPMNLRISRWDYRMLEQITIWHNSGDGKYLNVEILERAAQMSNSIKKLLELMNEHIVDDLDKSNLTADPTEEDLEEASKYMYWYFKKRTGSTSSEESQRVWDIQDKLYEATQEVKESYNNFRDSIRRNLFV